MNSKSKILIPGIVVILALGTVLGIRLIHNNTQTSTQQTNSSSPSSQASKTVVSYKGAEGKNALEALRQTHKVETKTYAGLGDLVTSIDGVAADSKHFWSLYVNGQQSQVGAASYQTKAADLITWKLEEIK